LEWRRQAVRPDVRTLKLTLAYDGTPFVGWQRQPTGVSVQALVEEALAPIEGRRVAIVGAGRTDAGVHALGQVASCRVETRLDMERIRRALNARLPDSIRVLRVEEAPDGFHARYWARAKTYAYRVLTGPIADPFLRALAWHVPQALDVGAMRAALVLLAGRHDFAAFQGAGSAVRDTVRTLLVTDLEETTWRGLFGDAPPAPDDSRLLVWRLTGDGFLRHMVRTIVGTVVEVGLGRREPGDMAALLASGDRRRAGPTAPAHGLTLVSVEYGAAPPDPGRAMAIDDEG
jgi:tRNA pseudouridine38-40 synthase